MTLVIQAITGAAAISNLEGALLSTLRENVMSPNGRNSQPCKHLNLWKSKELSRKRCVQHEINRSNFPKIWITLGNTRRS